MLRFLFLALPLLISGCHVDEPVAPPTSPWGLMETGSLSVFPCAEAGDCHDGSWCTNNFCISGRCAFVPKADYAVLCDDGNACTEDWCYTVTRCTNTPLNELHPCDDDHPCGLQYWCEAGSCTAVDDTLCDDGNACTLDKCSQSGCEHLPIADCM